MHARMRKFCQRGSNSDVFVLFLFYEGNEDTNSTKSGLPLTGKWWPNIECWLGSFMILQEIRTSIAKNPYIFVDPRMPCKLIKILARDITSS